MKPRPQTALILGISGQDGAYIADILLRRGIEVHGSARDKEASSFANLHRLGIRERVRLHSVSLADFRSVAKALQEVRPALIFNMAAQSSVGLSFEQPVETIDSIMHGTINVMEAMRFLRLEARFYSASSSECFGNVAPDRPADESTPFHPRSPYAVGKAAAFWAVANYREAYGLYACSGLLFNHESPMRPARYVTQKIIRGAVDIAQGVASSLELGSLDLHRDWGWAPEYAEAMVRMLDQPEPMDLVIATGATYSLRDFVAMAFERLNLDWREHVTSSEAFYRPTDISYSGGNPAKAKARLGWEATIRTPQVVDLLLEAELARRSLA